MLSENKIDILISNSFTRERSSPSLTQIYPRLKKRIRAYQLAFSAIAFIFLALSYMVYTKSATWAHPLFFEGISSLKNAIVFLSLCFSGISGYTAFQITPETEALNMLRQEARGLLRSSHHQTIASLKNTPYQLRNARIVAEKQFFHSHYDAINDAYAKTLEYLKAIRSNSSLDLASKEQYRIEAILSFHRSISIN